MKSRPRAFSSAAAAVALDLIALASSCAPAGPTAIGESQRRAVAALSGAVDRSSLEGFMAASFSESRNAWESPANVAAAQDSIESALRGYGYAVTRQPIWAEEISRYDPAEEVWHYEAGPFYMDNIIGEKPGADPDLAPVLVCAHHDTVVGTPGADDNGSGCAGVLEIARIFSGVDFDRTVRFCFFGFEENGMIGSRVYADSLPRGEWPDSVIVLEMIGFTSAVENPVPLAGPVLGFPSVGDFVGVVGGREGRSLTLDFLASAAEYSAGLPALGLSTDSNLGSDPFLRDTLRSDHEPFMHLGIPAVMVTDTANLRDGSHYHQPEDEAETLDFGFMTAVVRAAAATAAVRAGVR